MNVAGSNGLVGIGWGDVYQRWMLFKSNVGGHLSDILEVLKRIVLLEICHVGQGSVRLFFNGRIIHMYNNIWIYRLIG
jgi:hypothetical protein